MIEKKQMAVAQDSMFGIYKDLWVNRRAYYHNIIRPGYFSWLINQMKQWSRFTYALIGINFILQVFVLGQVILTQPTAHLLIASIFGFIGGNLSVMCVAGIANRSSIQGYFGITSAIAIAISAIMSKAYANAVEQLLIYIPFLDIPSILHPSWAEKIIPRKFKGLSDWMKFIIFGLISWAVLFGIFSLTDDVLVFTDSLTLAIAMTGSLAMLNRYSNQYYFWLANNVVSIILYVQAMQNHTASAALAVSYSIFVLNSLYGLISWTKAVDAVK